MKNIIISTILSAFFVLLFSGCVKDMESPPVYNPTPDLAQVDSVACEDPPLRKWLFGEYGNWGSLDIVLLVVSGELIIDQLAFFHALYFENSSANQSFGPIGEYTNQINQTASDIKRFWDTELDGIILVAFRGSMLQNWDKVVAVYKSPAFGFSDEKANAYADSVATLFNIYPQYNNGNHPAFSFNQFAIPDTTFAGVGQVPAKIVIGDGLLQGLDALGYGDIAPQAILAHEYAHHIQYDLGILVRGWQRGEELIPKTSRRIELMADAYAAYYLSHPRGANMQGENVQQILEVFSNFGDCEFKGDGHHGTPTQRKAAAEWGYKLAKDAHQKGHILPALELARLFDAELNNILE
jgi:hypothetical protein